MLRHNDQYMLELENQLEIEMQVAWALDSRKPLELAANFCCGYCGCR
jgi:hypothetical protein